MAKDKKVEQITDMEQDFAQWFTDVCTKAELVDYSGIKGLFILRPYGYAIWERYRRSLTGCSKRADMNVPMPMLIPESLLQKEKDHVEGFAPECAWVTVGGSEELPERLCIRPTSETLFCDHWSHIVHSWRDLPMKYNQWCSVLRWEEEPSSLPARKRVSLGRRVIPCTRPRPKHARKHCTSSRSMPTCAKTTLQCPSSAATRPRRKSSRAQ